MSQKNKLILIALVALAGLAYVLFLANKPIDWAENYLENSKQPFGTSVVHTILEDLFKTNGLKDLKERAEKSLPHPDSVKKGSTYMLIGDSFYADSADLDKIFAFVEKGNFAFIAANSLPPEIMERLKLRDCWSDDLPEVADTQNLDSSLVPTTIIDEDENNLNDDDDEGDDDEVFQGITSAKFMHQYDFFETETTDSTQVLLAHDTLNAGINAGAGVKYEFFRKQKRRTRHWVYADLKTSWCTELPSDTTRNSADVVNITPLGSFKIAPNKEFVNFIRLKHGEGAIFLHTNPFVFTNYNLLTSEKLALVERTFSHLPTTGTLYWDKIGRTPRELEETMGRDRNLFSKDGPLRFILKQPALRWAWFILLSLAAFYLLLFAKRKQRIIPILEEKKNTSLDFIQTIGQMYFRQGDHLAVCKTMLKHFQIFVRERYKLSVRTLQTETFLDALAQKSDVPLERIQRIAAYERRVEVAEITEESMIELHQLLQNFYKICK
jgi:hypothetical protein